MKRRFFFLTLLSLFLPMIASAYDAEIDGNYYNLSGSEATVTHGNSYNSYSGTVVIPKSVTHDGKTYSVTSIGDEAFRNCTNVTSVNIPNSLTSIGNYAFAFCSGLTSISIPNSVKSIESYAFSNCGGLTSVDIPNSVTSIGEGVFSECRSLSSITIPNSVTSISGALFAECSSLTSIVIPNSVTSIGGGAFSKCHNLTTITIPNSVTSIDGAFCWCSSLKSVTIPNNVTSIGNTTFIGCQSLTSITIPNNVKDIGCEAFRDCANLNSIVIPDGVLHIGSAAFSGCTRLASVTIPNSVTSIGNNAFSGCQNLTSITIPNSLTNISTETFSGCTSLTSAFIPNSVTDIGSKAFRNCRSLTSITIPYSVKDIGTEAFSGCTGLTLVTVPNGIERIGNGIFSGCSGLTSITIPDNVKKIGSYAFKDCRGLTSITIGSSVIRIYEGAFAGCTHLTDVHCMAKNVPITDSDAFDDSSIESATLHVLEATIESFERELPWKNFGSIEAKVIHQIGTAQDFVAFASLVNAGSDDVDAVLIADIDLSDVSSTWVPIGNTNKPYKGVFDGQNHKLTGFAIEAVSGDMKGLFGYVKDATIRNFSIEGNITYNRGTGVGVVGWSEGSIIHNVHSSLNIAVVASDSHHIGGICGSLRAGTIASSCSFSGIITETAGNDDCIGGIGGYSNEFCLYENCANYGTITFSATNAYAGGICGYVNNDNFLGVNNCLNVGKVLKKNGTPDYSGAIVGRLRKHANSLFENNYWLEGSAIQVSGENAVAATSVIAEQLASGEICYALNGDQTEINWYQTLGTDANPMPYGSSVVYLKGHLHCDGTYYDGTITNSYDNIISKDEHDFVDGICSYCSFVDVNYMETNAEGYYEIANAKQLAWFAAMVNSGVSNADANAILTDDVSLSGTWVNPIGTIDNPYKGVFDGQNHKLTSFLMETASGYRKGLFGYVKDATIQNFYIDGNITYYGGSNVGVIGWSEGSTIHNVHSSLNIAVVALDSHHIGGICGSLRTGSTASNCSFSGTLTDTAGNVDCLGGIVGYSSDHCLFVNCANYGTIFFTALSAYAGGICGYLNNDYFNMKHCLNVGKVQTYNGTPDYSGAIVGRLRNHANSVFENNYWLEGSAIQAFGEATDVTAVVATAEQLASGEICYALNSSQTEDNWYQTLGVDNFPVLDNRHLLVILANGSYVNEIVNYIINDETISFSVPAKRSGRSVNLTHDFNGEWESLYLPFAIDYDAIKADFDLAEIDGVVQNDDNNDGIADITVLSIMGFKGQMTEPNTPYLIRAKNAGEQTIVFDDVTVYPTEEATFECSSFSTRYEFTGSYNALNASALANRYIVQDGELVKGASSLAPCRWYMTATARKGSLNLPNRIRIMPVEDVITGSPLLTSPEEEGSIYDLSGRHIVNGTPRLQSRLGAKASEKLSNGKLPSGIYIKGGRKVLVK